MLDVFYKANTPVKYIYLLWTLEEQVEKAGNRNLKKTQNWISLSKSVIPMEQTAKQTTTLSAIRASEAQAGKIIKDAEEEAQQIIITAKQEAERKKEKKKAEFERKRKEELEKLSIALKKKREQELRKTKAQAQALAAKAAKRTGKAVDYLVSEFIRSLQKQAKRK